MKKMYFQTRNQEYQRILENLMRYPVMTVDPKVSQSFSRHKKIRYLSRFDNIFIKKGVISIPRQVKISKKNERYIFEFTP